MRLSTRLISNAATSYGRLGLTFALGIFMMWYIVGEVGLVGLGVISLSMGTLGMSAVDVAIRQSVVRELSASIASGDIDRIRVTVTSGMAYCVLAGLALLAMYCGLAGLALLGVFRVPEERPQLANVLAVLMVIEGLVVLMRLTMAPITQGVIASQRVAIDNLFGVTMRLVQFSAVLLAFGVFWPDGTLAQRLYGFGAVRLGAAIVELAFEVFVARRLVKGLSPRPGSYEHAEFKSIAGTVWHTGQVTLLAQSAPKMIMVVINLFFGLAYNGIWQIVTQVSGHAKMLGDAVLRGIDPITTHLQEAGQRETILYLMERTIRYQLVVVLPFAACYAILMMPILVLWVGGRLHEDEGLKLAGLGVDEALALAATMSIIGLLDAMLRVGTRGVERMLYGLGEIRSYSWWAKYSAMVSVGLAVLGMWIFESPLVAPIPLVIVAGLTTMIILQAARNRVGLSMRRVARAPLLRSLGVTVLVAGPVAIARPWLVDLTLAGLIGLGAAITTWYAIVVVLVGLDGDERARVMQIVRRRRAS